MIYSDDWVAVFERKCRNNSNSFIKLSCIGNVIFDFIEQDKLSDSVNKEIVVVALIQNGNKIVLNSNGVVPHTNVLERDSYSAMLPSPEDVFAASIRRVAFENGIIIRWNTIRLIGVNDAEKTYYFFACEMDAMRNDATITLVNCKELTKSNLLNKASLNDIFAWKEEFRASNQK